MGRLRAVWEVFCMLAGWKLYPLYFSNFVNHMALYQDNMVVAMGRCAGFESRFCQALVTSHSHCFLSCEVGVIKIRTLMDYYEN